MKRGLFDAALMIISLLKAMQTKSKVIKAIDFAETTVQIEYNYLQVQVGKTYFSTRKR